MDTWRALHPAGQDPSTQHDFYGQVRGHRIDWILTSEPFRVTKGEIVGYNRAWSLSSDHFPYIAQVDY